jgi:hypothetical protein
VVLKTADIDPPELASSVETLLDWNVIYEKPPQLLFTSPLITTSKTLNKLHLIIEIYS